MIDSLTVGGTVLEKDVPDVIDNEHTLNVECIKPRVEFADGENNLIYDLKTMTNSRLKDMIDTIAIGCLHQPLIFSGIDWSKKPDYAGRVTYWVAPFKYKTAGFNHQLIHSDCGFVWRLWNYPGLNLKDLPINYNFDMADRYYEKYLDDIIREFDRLLLNKTLDDLFDEFVSHFDIPKEYLLPQHNENKLNKLFITTRRKLK